jgi:dGTPase
MAKCPIALDWNRLLTTQRRSSLNSEPPKRAAEAIEYRTETERDYDRVLFSAPVRRLADKTQVFPLEKNDSVRTRLTHSHEVSTLARSVGVALVNNYKCVFEGVPDAHRNVPAMLAAVGLAHDLGNPPFGHQGERAIARWFYENRGVLTEGDSLTRRMQQDFLAFEGNAQTLRIVSHLQLPNDGYSLNLTLGTLGALMKYTVRSDNIDKRSASTKKFGYFRSEDSVVDDIRTITGLSEGIRHPLAFIMEACDDLAYSVLDVEDAVKKALVSVADILWWLKEPSEPELPTLQQNTLMDVQSKAENDYYFFRKQKLSPPELNDIAMQKLRVHAIESMVHAVVDEFNNDIDPIMSGTYASNLLLGSRAGGVCAKLKEFAEKHVYVHRSVREVELQGHWTIQELMRMFWTAISAKRKGQEGPFESYVNRLISENYARAAQKEADGLPPRYRDCLLLTDMISGMTDGYAVGLYNDLRVHEGP